MTKSKANVLVLLENSRVLSIPSSFYQNFNVQTHLNQASFYENQNIVGIIIDTKLLSEETCAILISSHQHFSVALLGNNTNKHLIHKIRLLFQTISFSTSPSCDDFNAIKKMFQTSFEMQQYQTALKIQAQRSRLYESLNIVAHQWRQPINLISMEAINLIIQSSESERVLSTSVQQSASLIAEHTQKMSDILKSVLSLGKLNRAKEPFMINPLLDKIELSFTNQFKKNKISLIVLKLDLDKLLYGLHTDLEEVIINLLVNAKDAYSTTTIEIAKIITLTAYVTEDSLLFVVSDQAGGVPKSIQDKIFEPHFSTKKEDEGFGIGLHVARLIIEQEFKGTLTLKVFNNETVFTITLPRNDLSNLKFINT